MKAKVDAITYQRKAAPAGWIRFVAGHPQSQIDDLLPWAYTPEPLRAVA